MTIIWITIFWLIVAFCVYFFVEYKNYKRNTIPFLAISTIIGGGITHIFLFSISNDYAIYKHIGDGKLDMAVTGQVGDFLGGVIGTIIAGISIILLYNTFIEQKVFSKTQTEYLIKNEKAQNNQQFESTFFQLLQTHNNLKQSIQFNTKERLTWWNEERQEPERVVMGSEFFEFAKWDFYRLYQPDGQIHPAITVRHDHILEGLLPNPPINYEPNQPIERIKQKYKKFLDVYHSYLGHYFRNVYYLLKYVEKHEEGDKLQEGIEENEVFEKYKFYIGTLQSQMSSSELFLLFYNGLCFPKMRELIIKYRMLENLAKEDLADSDRHQNLYEGITLKTRYTIINDSEQAQ